MSTALVSAFREMDDVLLKVRELPSNVNTKRNDSSLRDLSIFKCINVVVDIVPFVLQS